MSKARAWVLIAMLAGGAVTVFARSLQITVLEHERWAEVASNQHHRVLVVQSQRGDIRSADGYLLATSVDRLAIQVDTHLLHHPELFATVAAGLLDTPVEELLERLRSGPRTVWLAQRVERDAAARVRLLAPSAVVLVPDSQREYPLGPVAAAVVGFVGREELRTVGRVGIESSYDALLAGQPERHLAVRDAVQRQLRLERVQAGRAGYDLELTIHARIQAAAERELEATVLQTGASAASAVVLDPHSGAILALVSIPSFDPAAPSRAPRECWRLRPVVEAYEPGSTIKPMVVAASLAAGAVGWNERIDCRQKGIRVGTHWVRDHAAADLYTVDEVVAHSSNAGIIILAERLTPQALWTALDAFGFGRSPEVGFAGESPGLLSSVRTWSSMSRAGVALGQELTASPLQLALAYAAIANGGWVPRPRLVQRASSGPDVNPAVLHLHTRVMDRALSERITTMLELAVTDGTAKRAGLPGFRVAGKTGTAQRAVNGQFDDQHHVSWFAGFLPLPDPRLVIVVAVENPTKDFWGATVAAPAFAGIAQACVRLLEIPPEPTDDIWQAPPPDPASPPPAAGGGEA